MKIREFYYKFLCNRLATGYWLYRVGITNSNVCTFCNCEKETVEHLFIKCDITRTFWENTQNGGIMLQESLKILLRKILC